MKFSESLFKAYDIRGNVSDLTEELAEAIGKATADFLPQVGAVAVGFDMRPDSQALASAVMMGLTTQGREVWDLGQVTSDMSYFAVGKYGLAGSLMVTASHNPGKDNGMKIYRDEVTAVSLDSGLASIRDAIVADRFKQAAEKPGKRIKKDVTDDWIEHCMSFATVNLKPFHIAIDAGNGMAGLILPRIQEKWPLKVTELYYDLDGTFPNHEANPMKVENLVDLMHAVTSGGLDFGVAFDGDGDRAAFVDDKGRPVSGSDLLAIIARHYLDQHPGSAIVHEVRTSRATRELIREWGGEPVLTKAGRIDVGRKLRELNAPFGGETTGHLFFRENFFADAAMVGVVVTLTALSESGKKLSELVDEYHRYAMSPETNFRVADPKAVLGRLRETYRDGTQSTLDGLTVEYQDWWFNLRISNTEPVVRLNIEAKNEALLASKKQEVAAVIEGRHDV